MKSEFQKFFECPIELIDFFLDNTEYSYTVEEIAKEIKLNKIEVKKWLNHLLKYGVISLKNRKYKTNKESPIFRILLELDIKICESNVCSIEESVKVLEKSFGYFDDGWREGWKRGYLSCLKDLKEILNLLSEKKIKESEKEVIQ